jgi:hypothetical protein
MPPIKHNPTRGYTRAFLDRQTLFGFLADLLPAEARLAPLVAPEMVRSRINPMVKGLVQSDWQEIALRELTARTFVLNFQGAN